MCLCEYFYDTEHFEKDQELKEDIPRAFAAII